MPADDDTQFMIGSVTKTFTALTVMSLRDEGRLTLDDALETYLPGTKHARVPLRQMLAHASGLQREPVGNIWESLEAPEREEFLAGVEEAEQVLPAHHAFHYSNLAYGLLGQVVERVTGQDWEHVVRERVLEPLGMTRTGLTPADDRAARLPGRPVRRHRERGAALHAQRDRARSVGSGRPSPTWRATPPTSRAPTAGSSPPRRSTRCAGRSS